MSPFARRRRIGLGALAIASVLFLACRATLEVSLRSAAFFSGWLLLGLVAALTLFHARKKVPFAALGNATAWMEFHAYAGIFSIVVFVAHVGFRVPNGLFEGALAGVFALVAGSGVIGLVLTRLLPVRLTTRGEAILYERIPQIRIRLHDEVEDLVLRSAAEVQTTTIADFYSAQLADFFRRPRNFVFHLLDSPRPSRVLARELWALDRYANDREREILSAIHERVRAKDDLDYQRAQQLALKGWLFFHIPLTYALMLLAVLHILLVYGFQGTG